MIPILLEIENFLSYGKRQIIDFAGYPLICLSGKNGHGKSALLDAMTWAIWGQARKVSGAAKPDDNLLRLGQTFMTVIFEFEFNGLKYRIKREYAKTYAKPYASLDFGVYDQTTRTIKALTDKTIKATQEKIEETIGLDYDTFINSAFLRQGGSNEFSKKSAKERKQILSAILGLNQFETLKLRALEKAKEYTTQKKYKVEHAQKSKVQLERFKEVTLTLEDIINNIAVLTQAVFQLEEKIKQLAQQKNVLTVKIEQRNLLIRELEKQELQRKTENTTLKTMWQEWRALLHVTHTLQNKDQLETRKQDIIILLSIHQSSYEKQLALKEQLLLAKEKRTHYIDHHKIQYEKERQEQQLNIAHQEMLSKDIVQKLSQLAHAKEQTEKQIGGTLKTIIELKSSIEYSLKIIAVTEKQRSQFEKRKTIYHSWLAQAQQLVKEQAELAQKRDISLDQDNPSCPLCEQNLSASRKRFIQSKLLGREHFIAHRIARFKKIIAPLKEILLSQHAQFEELQKIQQETEGKRVEMGHLQKEHETLLAVLRETDKQHAHLSKELSAIGTALQRSKEVLKDLEVRQEKKLLENVEYQLVCKQIETLDQESVAVAYNAEQHIALKKTFEDIEKQLALYKDLEKASYERQERKKALLAHIMLLRTLKKHQEELKNTIVLLQTLDTEHQKVVSQENELTERIALAHKEKDLLSRTQGSLEHERTQLAQLAKEFDEEQKQIVALDSSSFEYGAIATALGKDGIQALLIEETIPEIEAETNALLAQLSDNQAHIMIESLKDLKKGGTKETLDINISDSQGIRPYELFSGGEAFRIDFALRIAISKLLARRAGTSLQTLIIDEGFGSQDEEGLQRLMEAIYAIQDNFCKIIIVSHLPSMKEQFPVHFVVDKGPQGSTVSVFEQG